MRARASARYAPPVMDIVTLRAARFTRAAPLRHFLAAVSQLPCVTTATPLRFSHGMVVLTVTCGGRETFCEQLRTLPGFGLQITADGNAIRAEVEEG